MRAADCAGPIETDIVSAAKKANRKIFVGLGKGYPSGDRPRFGRQGKSESRAIAASLQKCVQIQSNGRVLGLCAKAAPARLRNFLPGRFCPINETFMRPAALSDLEAAASARRIHRCKDDQGNRRRESGRRKAVRRRIGPEGRRRWRLSRWRNGGSIFRRERCARWRSRLHIGAWRAHRPSKRWPQWRPKPRHGRALADAARPAARWPPLRANR